MECGVRNSFLHFIPRVWVDFISPTHTLTHTHTHTRTHTQTNNTLSRTHPYTLKAYKHRDTHSQKPTRLNWKHTHTQTQTHAKNIQTQRRTLTHMHTHTVKNLSFVSILSFPPFHLSSFLFRHPKKDVLSCFCPSSFFLYPFSFFFLSLFSLYPFYFSFIFLILLFFILFLF